MRKTRRHGAESGTSHDYNLHNIWLAISES